MKKQDKKVELAAFLRVLEEAERRGQTIIGFKMLNVDTGLTSNVPTQLLTEMILSEQITSTEFLRLMSIPPTQKVNVNVITFKHDDGKDDKT